MYVRGYGKRNVTHVALRLLLSRVDPRKHTHIVLRISAHNTTCYNRVNKSRNSMIHRTSSIHFSNGHMRCRRDKKSNHIKVYLSTTVNPRDVGHIELVN